MHPLRFHRPSQYYCKNKQQEWEKKKKGKVNTVTVKEKKKEEESPDEGTAKGKQVKASEEDSPDEDDECEKYFANQCIAIEEGKKTYFSKEGGKFSTDMSSWKEGRRRRKWGGPRSLKPISERQKCRAQQVSGSRSVTLAWTRHHL